MSRIYNNTMSLNTQRMLNKNTLQQSKVLEKLSSGLAINRAADDAAGLSISEKMRGSIQAMKRSSKNAQDAISLVQATEAALDEVSTMLERCAYLAEQLHDDINDANDTTAINNELTQLQNQMNCIIQNTKFNGTNINAIGTKKFGIDGSDKTLGIGTAVNSVTGAGSGATVASVTAAMVAINKTRSYLGAMQNRLEYAKNNNDANMENLQAAESRIRDTDMAAMMSDFNKYNILTQAATSMLAQANAAPQSVLSLLQ